MTAGYFQAVSRQALEGMSDPIDGGWDAGSLLATW